MCHLILASRSSSLSCFLGELEFRGCCCTPSPWYHAIARRVPLRQFSAHITQGATLASCSGTCQGSATGLWASILASAPGYIWSRIEGSLIWIGCPVLEGIKATQKTWRDAFPKYQGVCSKHPGYDSFCMFLFFLYWSIVYTQYYIGFRCTTQWSDIVYITKCSPQYV